MNRDQVFKDVGGFMVTDSATKALLAMLPSTKFEGTSDDYLNSMRSRYDAAREVSPGLWYVRIDLDRRGKVVVEVVKPVEKTGFIRRMWGGDYPTGR